FKMGNQMREYTKPIMNVERFMINTTIADCGDPIYTAVDVNCDIKSGYAEGVFYSGNGTACTFYATTSNTKTINGITYFYWYGAANGNPADGGTNEDGSMYGSVLMNALKGAGVSDSDGNGNVLHAGVASAKILSYINSSI
ncbi:MAG: hypothetical protein LUH02_07910, partial [Erysipelotrichaceae bacterium]|nr:hypothetical protein [Erysipelotrichaceae bacterium]